MSKATNSSRGCRSSKASKKAFEVTQRETPTKGRQQGSHRSLSHNLVANQRPFGVSSLTISTTNNEILPFKQRVVSRSCTAPVVRLPESTNVENSNQQEEADPRPYLRQAGQFDPYRVPPFPHHRTKFAENSRKYIKAPHLWYVLKTGDEEAQPVSVRYPRPRVNAHEMYYPTLVGRSYLHCAAEADMNEIPHERFIVDAKKCIARTDIRRAIVHQPGPPDIPTVVVEPAVDRGLDTSIALAAQSEHILQVPPGRRKNRKPSIVRASGFANYTPRTPQTPTEMKEEVRKMAMIPLPPVSAGKTTYRQVRLEPIPEVQAAVAGPDSDTPLRLEKSERADGYASSDASDRVFEDTPSGVNLFRDECASTKVPTGRRARIELQHVITTENVPEFIRTVLRSGKHAAVGVDVDIGMGDVILHLEFRTNV